MLKRDYEGQNCSVARALEVVGGFTAVFNDAKKDNDGDMMHLSDTTDKPRDAYVMLGGDCNRHGDAVQPGVPAVIDSPPLIFHKSQFVPAVPAESLISKR